MSPEENRQALPLARQPSAASNRGKTSLPPAASRPRGSGPAGVGREPGRRVARGAGAGARGRAGWAGSPGRRPGVFPEAAAAARTCLYPKRSLPGTGAVTGHGTVWRARLGPSPSVGGPRGAAQAPPGISGVCTPSGHAPRLLGGAPRLHRSPPARSSERNGPNKNKHFGTHHRSWTLPATRRYKL